MRALIIVFFGLFSVSTMAQPNRSVADAILGHWLTEEGKARIEIYKCQGKYCGKIVWLRDPKNEDGSIKKDTRNPEEDLQNRAIMGLNLLEGFVYDEDYEWNDGEIYDPDSGKTYSCIITLEDNKKTLNVRGYIGFSLIGRTSVWTKTEL